MSFAALQTRVNAAIAAKLMTDFATLNSVAISGRFSNGSDSGLSGMMLGTNPTFTCTAADAGSDARGKILIFETVSYTVREVKPDGTGLVLFELEQV